MENKQYYLHRVTSQMAVPATVSYNVVQMPGSGDWDWVNEERKHEVLQELRIFLVSDGSLLNLKLPISK